LNALFAVVDDFPKAVPPKLPAARTISASFYWPLLDNNQRYVPKTNRKSESEYTSIPFIKPNTVVIKRYTILQDEPKTDIQEASSKLGTMLRKTSTAPKIPQNAAYEEKHPLWVHTNFDTFCIALAAVITREMHTNRSTVNCTMLTANAWPGDCRNQHKKTHIIVKQN